MPEGTGELGERLRPLLRAVGIGKAFVGNRVLDGVDLDVMPGEVHAIVGENGAGKSTLIKILGGVYQPDDGQLVVDGEARRFRSPRERSPRASLSSTRNCRSLRASRRKRIFSLADFPGTLSASSIAV